MTTLYRLIKQRHSGKAFDGSGGLIVGGRWHRKGIPVVYAAQSLSLAALEFFVHFGKSEQRIALVYFELKIEDALIDVLDSSVLPADWRAEPPAASTAAVGTAWLRSGKNVALRVPSVISPGESNYVINPAHPAISRMSISKPFPYSFDPRLWK